MSRLLVAAALAALALGGCGHSQHESITEYCRGRLSCGIDPSGSQAVLDACIARYEDVDGSPQEQCYATHVVACVGECYRDKGCTVFMQNDPCSCEIKDYGCPE